MPMFILLFKKKTKAGRQLPITMGHPEWATDERFKDWEHRQLHKQEISPLD